MIYSLNETLEYRMKNLFSKSVMTFYHASHIGDLDVIKPNSANSGTRLSKPRMSSFWSTDKDTCKMVSMYLTFYSSSDPVICDCTRKKVYVSQQKFDHLKEVEGKGNFLYLYEADIPTKYMGIGHDIVIDEYSCDVEVKPKKMYKYKPTESGLLEIKSKEEIAEIRETKGTVIGSRKASGIEKLVYHKDLSSYRRTTQDISRYNEFYDGIDEKPMMSNFESIRFLNDNHNNEEYHYTNFLETLKAYDIDIDYEIITEAIDISQIWSNIKKMIINLWNKISLAILKFFGNIKFIIQNKTLYYKKNKNKIIEGFDKLSKASFPGYTYDYEKITEYINRIAYMSNSYTLNDYKHVYVNAKAGNLFEDEGSYRYSNLLSDIYYNIFHEDIDDNKGYTIDDIRNKINKNVHDSVIKESDNILSRYKSADEFFNYLTANYNNKLRDIVKSKNNIESIVNKMLKKINEEEKKAKSSNIYDDDLREELRLMSIYYNFSLNISKDISISLCKFINDDYNQARKIADKCIEISNEKVGKSSDKGLTDAFYDAVNNGNIRRVRIMMSDSLLVDLTFQQFSEMEKVVNPKMSGLYDKHNKTELSQDKSTWSVDYLDKLMVKVITNFSHERIQHIKEVITYLVDKGELGKKR